jgi:hypothetical protein
VFWSDLANEPDAVARLVRSVSEDDGDVQALVDSIESAVTGASASSKLNASSSKRKQLHSLGSLLDGFNERVADLEKSAKARMDSFSEIRCDVVAILNVFLARCRVSRGNLCSEYKKNICIRFTAVGRRKSAFFAPILIDLQDFD